MATYAIGDVQGCFDELLALLERLPYRADADRLWFVGDLVNRGPKSLETLRFVRGLGARAVTVLGNHDLHLLTQYEGLERRRKDDTFDDVLAAADAAELLAWLRTRPLMHCEDGFAMVHAGLLPQWSVEKSISLAREVERALAAPGYRDFLEHLYGGLPDQWNDSLRGWDRLRVIVNAMTRMRYCTPDGRMDFRAKGREAPPGTVAWFDARPREESTLVCGHWSALGVKLTPKLAALDSGCVWGGALSALRLEDRTLHQVACASRRVPGGAHEA
ncbi:MAG TPA: symmetrical bis(5'-nucleosyl)-tetraphosphatase [Burkholderiales bacterium]|nr:symmetrical bis(5'-nucleosyl)-tetraphosphatase [Burkholderiales bacterium]